ncbi:hypothetical protein [Pseudoroseomonas ludipueritiae]|uniref:Uncharacterized protein n=1 Tax=Pseudoroseomonas ludipueritiae TaxID=198093 RepID=A0ABR7R391_9PROT|nr:hypothetical protein [Pseudoroseomonas ludipueritiae]MBC9176159.1 hypothetical protein [Pseudoroseomonas ludipueritiae]
MSTTMNRMVSREKAPILCIFGNDAAAMAQVIRAAPDLGRRLALAPRRAVHALAAFLASEAARRLNGAELIAELRTHHPRDLLHAALPGCDRRLYKTLNRAALPAWSLAEYAMVDALLRAEVGAVTSGTGPLTRARVATWHECLGEEPAFARWLAPFDDTADRAGLRVVLTWLRHAGLLTEPAPEGEAEPIAVSRAVVRMISQAKGPEAPFVVPEGWQQLRSARELLAMGRRLGNCLRATDRSAPQSIQHLLTGQVVFLHHAKAAVLAGLMPEPGGFWSVAVIQGRRNRPAPSWLVETLISALKASGIAVLPMGLDAALRASLDPLYWIDFEKLQEQVPDIEDGWV